MVAPEKVSQQCGADRSLRKNLILRTDRLKIRRAEHVHCVSRDNSSISKLNCFVYCLKYGATLVKTEVGITQTIALLRLSPLMKLFNVVHRSSVGLQRSDRQGCFGDHSAVYPDIFYLCN